MKTRPATPAPIESDERTAPSPFVAPIPSPRRDRPPGPTAAATASGFISGFGTLMEMERELQSLQHRCLAEFGRSPKGNLNRILDHHIAQVDAIIALLALRQDRLPRPGRFLAPRHGGSSSAAAGAVGMDSSKILAELAQCHRELIRRVDALADHDGGSPAAERGLREVAQRHENLAWMLTALLNEGTSAEGRWENEGGALPQEMNANTSPSRPPSPLA